MRVPLLLLDDHACLVHLNRPALELTSTPWIRPVGLQLGSVDRGEPWKSAAELVREASARGGAHRRFVRDEVRRRTWDVEVCRLDEVMDGQIQFVVAMHDVTRAAELQDTLARGDGLAALGALTAGVAHEVRNPLFAISATLDAFADDSENAKLVSALRCEVDRLAQLVRELLEYGRAEATERIADSVTEVADEARATTALLATARGVRVVVSSPTRAIAPIERERISLVCRNVIENAIHHSPAGSVVEVEISESVDAEGHWVDVVVLDRGPGFPPDALDRVFVPFFTRRAGGTGLGLALVQRIVQAHGGRVTASQRSGGGALVAFSLPAHRRDGSYPGAQPLGE